MVVFYSGIDGTQDALGVQDGNQAIAWTLLYLPAVLYLFFVRFFKYIFLH